MPTTQHFISTKDASFWVWFSTVGLAPTVWCLTFGINFFYKDISYLSKQEMINGSLWVFFISTICSYIATLPALLGYTLSNIFILGSVLLVYCLLLTYFTIRYFDYPKVQTLN